ncbi:molybdopterin molybdotransferase MoeA [Rubripirellula reticaptiva]|uniref:Molybdopterin molybdenumtransferase n=1 Tax=Rubripirellula reticaptiva TaxID=2528013 RepID=A0A5C6F2M5_9BACT|nr:molybdopterin molybdotransferase MoeA [Rubripirellula reticaptiva]TWU56043.1 Molybdopterin molybdenumtransferase [Rubripirellula reticaptiva]
MAGKFAFDHPDEALRAIAEKLSVVGIEKCVDIQDGGGRVLARSVMADRDSPAADVSAMDGYAVRISQLQLDAPVIVVGQSVPGGPPPAMPAEGVVQVFTGAIIPSGAEAVVKREDTDENIAEGDGQIRFHSVAMQTSMGENIRRAGENASAGKSVLPPGKLMTAADKAVAVNFGCFENDFHTPVKVGVITTGDEVGLFVNECPQPWQLQNSNRFALDGLLENKPWIERCLNEHCRDDKQSLAEGLVKAIAMCDVVLMTGGVSMGDYDYVPDVVRDVGGEVVFHGLPIRPGKPILGAVTGEGKLILGLPGNPVSATIGCRRMALPLIAKISGQTDWLPKQAVVELDAAGSKTLPLHWMRLARLTDHGKAVVVESRGSGDLVSMAQSDGFVEVAATEPGGTCSAAGPWPFYPW